MPLAEKCAAAGLARMAAGDSLLSVSRAEVEQQLQAAVPPEPQGEPFARKS